MNRLLIILVVLMLLSVGCIGNNKEDSAQTTDSKLKADPHIEVIHFYGNMQCYSCRVVGAYAEATVNEYFADEIQSGDLVFRHVNYDLPENRELAKRYGAAYSSLWIGTYNENGFTAEQNVNVWYLINDKEKYMAYLRGVINEKLEGL
ncbi:hypothetical protein Mpsy_0222 [Methanolobus psychrophilus R15]|nr:hypothetical protein Mpsy_0222 [Methanolobus psychrophilus R15]